MQIYILIFESIDQKGIVAKISNFIFQNDGNIISLDQYSTDPKNGHFFMRCEFCFDNKKISPEDPNKLFAPIAKRFKATVNVYDKSKKPKMGILVSKPDHCLADLLYHWKSGELAVDIPLIISNYPEHKTLAKQYKIPFYYLKIDQNTEAKILKLTAKTDFLALARYMQILSPRFLTAYNKDIINIHHSFLPSFKGSNPYEQAYNKGVKIIGATAHFVTNELDEGQIIEQMVEKVTHKDTAETLKQKGKILEKLTLAKALEAYLDHRIIKYQNKTIVF